MKITPLPAILQKTLPENHVYIGKGGEIKTVGGGSRFPGYISNYMFTEWGNDPMLVGNIPYAYYCVPKDSEMAKLNAPAPAKRIRKPKTEYFFAKSGNGSTYWTYKYSNRTGKLKNYTPEGVKNEEGATAKACVEYSRKYQKRCTRAEFLAMIKEMGWKENSPGKPNTSPLAAPAPGPVSLKHQIEILKHEKKILINEKNEQTREHNDLKDSYEKVANEVKILKAGIKKLKEENDALKGVLEVFAKSSEELAVKYAALKANQIQSHPADGC